MKQRVILDFDSPMVLELLEGFQGSKKKLFQDLIEDSIENGEIFRVIIEKNSGAIKEGYRYKYNKNIDKGMKNVKEVRFEYQKEAKEKEAANENNNVTTNVTANVSEDVSPAKEAPATQERAQIQTTVKPVMTNTETVRTRPAGVQTRSFKSSDFRKLVVEEQEESNNGQQNANLYDFDN